VAGDDGLLAGRPGLVRADDGARGVVDVPEREPRPPGDDGEVPGQVRAPGALGHRPAVARAVDDAREDGDERGSGGGHRRGHLVVGPPLRLVVDAPERAVVSVRLVDDPPAGVPVDRERADVQRARDVEVGHQFEHVPGPLDVDSRGEGAAPRARSESYHAAMWRTPSTPAIGSRRLARSATSPATSRTPAGGSVTRSGSRLGATTS
jgi:hypothetical protein